MTLTTPEVFIFSGKFTLTYENTIDTSFKLCNINVLIFEVTGVFYRSVVYSRVR